MKKIFTVLFFIAFMQKILICQPSPQEPSGEGTELKPYQIASLENLYWIATQVNSETTHFTGEYFKQTADINASGTSSWNSGAGWLPIGNTSDGYYFEGTYNGNNCKISGLTINRPAEDYVGLFSVLVGDISSLFLTNASITGHDNVGGIAGSLDSYNMEFCSSSGNVSGRFYIGGITGYNYSYSIKYSYSTCTITGDGVVGGIAGQNDSGTIEDCYATGNVTASGNYDGCGHSGGLVGFNIWGSINRCYATGLVTCVYTTTGFYGGLVGRSEYGTTSNSFWDTQTTGQASSPAGGTGKTTTEMKTQSTFTPTAGWDFTTIWQIQGGDGANYPDLRSNSNPALPVELTSFVASVVDNKVSLSWSTATEVNNYGFEIERSTNLRGLKDGNGDQNLGGFKSIGFVEGNGNSNSAKKYSFTDKDVASGSYSYRLKQIDIDGSFSYSKEITVETRRSESVPTEFVLEQNYPNPFNPATTIKYTIPGNVEKSYPDKSGQVMTSLRVHDILGKEVAVLVNQKQTAGNYEVKFDGSRLASGVYLYRLQSGSYVQTRKFVLMK